MIRSRFCMSCRFLLRARRPAPPHRAVHRDGACFLPGSQAAVIFSSSPSAVTFNVV